MHLMNQILIMTLLSKRYLHYNQISSIISIYVPFPDQFVLHTLIRKLTVSIQTNAEILHFTFNVNPLRMF